MKSSYLTNSVLLIIVITLLWWSQREPSPSETPVTISSLNAADITSIQIQRTNKNTIKLARQQDKWVMTEPFSARANQTRTDLLLSLLASKIHGQFQPLDQASLDQFGLTTPESQLLLNGEAFLFGGIESLSQQRYVLHKGMIYLVEDTVSPLLKATAGSFIDNRVIEESKTITQLTLPLNTSESINISQKQGHWQSDNVQLSSDKLKALIDSWQHAYAMQVNHIDDSKLQALPAPQIQVWLDDDTAPVNLILSENEQSLRLINAELQLQYDFPLALKAQLLPQAVSE